LTYYYILNIISFQIYKTIILPAVFCVGVKTVVKIVVKIDVKIGVKIGLPNSTKNVS